MKTIRRRTYIFAAFTVFGMVASVSIIACRVYWPELQTQILLIASAAVCGCMAILWAWEYKKLKIARLIVENHIFSIRTAVINRKSADTMRPAETENIVVFVSYFGILLDSKIIKFNQDGIRLKAVEFGRDFISLTYGTDKRLQSARLLRPVITCRELEGIAEKFRFETGIVPVINY